MKELNKYLSVLSSTASKSDYPFYAQYLLSKDGYVITCDGLGFTRVNCKLPFEGCINFFVLKSILSKVSDSAIFGQKDNTLEITDDSYKTSLNIITIDIPEVDKPKIDVIEVTPQLLDILKLSSRFTGSDILSNIFVCNNFICATDETKLFYHPMETSISTVGLPKQIFSILTSTDCKLGAFNNNILIEFDGGYSVFTSSIMDYYPSQDILTFVNTINESKIELCEMSQLKNAIDKLSPIFFGESTQVVDILNKSNKLIVSAQSSVHGKSEIITTSSLKDKFSMRLNSSQLNAIPLEYKVYISEKKGDMLLFSNEESIIIVRG